MANIKKQKIIIVTGSKQGIGQAIFKHFSQAGYIVEGIDLLEGECVTYVGDISQKHILENFARYCIEKHGQVDALINNAAPLFKGIDTCSYEEFLYAQQVGVVAPFYLAKCFKNHFAKGASIINISSTRDQMSQAQSESYTAAKGGIRALTHALAVSLSGIARANSISPGWIDTKKQTFSLADTKQHPSQRVGKPEDIVSLIAFLISEEASFINGENIAVDGGMSKRMIYHGDQGWSYEEN